MQMDLFRGVYLQAEHFSQATEHNKRVRHKYIITKTLLPYSFITQCGA